MRGPVAQAMAVVCMVLAGAGWLDGADRRAEDAKAAATAREIRKRVIVAAPPQEVWRAWTTVAGATSFFAPEAMIELRQGGPYELYFLTDAPRGERGSEGAVIVAFREPDYIAFTWNAPTTMPTVRPKHTLVIVQLRRVTDATTAVDLLHTGWGHGAAWDEAYEFFGNAWDVVLARLVRRYSEATVQRR